MRAKRKIDKDLDYSEAAVKGWVNEVLKEFNVYAHKPVPHIGGTGVDFHCVVKYGTLPLAFFIETKKFGKEFTERQYLFASARLREQGAQTFLIDGMVGVGKLRKWLEALRKATAEDGQ
jgi:hypothetical protein